MFGHNKGQGGLLSRIGGASFPMGPRQLNLVASEGFSGNGMATIGMDNTFSVIAHLPPPHTVSGYPAVYAAYLVDANGKTGFYAGSLKPAGNGMYQASFRSPVPLVHYDKVVVSLESPQRIMQAPQGPIVMKVKESLFGGGLEPIKRIGGDMWGRIKGYAANRFGGRSKNAGEQIPMQQPVYPQQGNYTFQQGNYTSQQGNYAPQPGYPQHGGYQQGAAQQERYGCGYQTPPREYRQAYQKVPRQPVYHSGMPSQAGMQGSAGMGPSIDGAVQTDVHGAVSPAVSAGQEYEGINQPMAQPAIAEDNPAE
jgi:hypothetical protein